MMNLFKSFTFAFLLMLTASFNLQARSQGEVKTLSPYFFIQSENGNEQMPLKSTEAKVDIAGAMADVQVSQIYKNEGNSPIEAIYVFPASTRAAVHGLRMTIGERVVTAKISKKDDARKEYDQAKQQGKSATLLEQHRPNVFQMNVANIMPGDIIKVELFYVEALIPENGIYEFVYPTVVGPRYSNQPASDLTASSDSWTSNPYTSEKVLPFYDFNMTCNVNAGIPIHQLRSTSHETDIKFSSSSKAIVNLKETEKKSGNKDFILQYRLKGNKIESGVLLYEGEKENYFMMMMQPPARVNPEMIPPREYVFIVDVSGSMRGFPLDVSKSLLKDLIGNLKPTDKFNIIFFSGGSNILSENSLPANSDNLNKALSMLSNQRGGGGTQLLPALKRALSLPTEEEFSRTFIIATDGYVSVEKEAFELIRENLGNANFFTFGIGSSVNRFLIEGMARVGKGEPFTVTKQSEAAQNAKMFREYIQSPVLTNVAVTFNGFDVYDVEPSNIPDIFSDRPVMVYGKYKGTPSGSIKISGENGEGNFSKSFNLDQLKASKENRALRYIWARNRIALIDDYKSVGGSTSEMIDEVTQIGLDYNLLTAYTSFVAIDNQIRNEAGELITTKQPLPLPEGVSNSAIGNHGNGGFHQPVTSARNKSMEMKSDRLLEMPDAPAIETDEVIMEPEPLTIIYPEFKGGQDAMIKWFKENSKYPETGKSNITSGTVYLEIEIDQYGKVVGVKVLRSLSPEFDKEAIRLANSMPDWIPGKINGKVATVKINLPVKFKDS